jgi:hypothetical protein
MKIAVVGSRTFNDYALLKQWLDKLHAIEPINLIISGGARGADSLSEQWALEIFKPDWNKFGKRAGFLRNVDIVTAAEGVIAFWDGTSRGTQHSINLAKEQGKPIKIIKFIPA